jgi:hypothetical protein
LIAISEARVNIEVEETPKVVIAEIIPKVLREVHAETIEVSFRKKVIPKTLSSIAPRDTRSATNQGIGPRTTQQKSNKRIISDSKTNQGLDTQTKELPINIIRYSLLIIKENLTSYRMRKKYLKALTSIRAKKATIINFSSLRYTLLKHIITSICNNLWIS